MRALFNPSRRQALKLTAAGLLTLGSGAWAKAPAPAESAPSSSSLKPYESIIPPITSDGQIVRLFFAYDCQHCRSYHNGLTQWGESLPAPWQFVATPVITAPDNDNQIMAIFGRLIAEELDPNVIRRYDALIYERLQDDPSEAASTIAELSTNHVLGALVDAGLQRERLQAFLESDRWRTLEQKIPNHAKVIATYRLRVTPSVAVGGRYVVNPDHANGQASQFLILLNGIVSRVIEEQARQQPPL